MPEMALRQDDETFIELEVVRRKWPDSDSSWDGNWLIVRVRARMCAVSIEYLTEIQFGDLRHFLEGLREGPYEGDDCFDFQPLDGGVLIFITEIRPGTFQARGTLSPTAPHHLSAHHQFELILSRTDLDDLAKAVEFAILMFPERGTTRDGTEPWLEIPWPN